MFSLVELRILSGLLEGMTLSQIAGRVHVGQPAVSKLLRESQRKSALTLVEQHGRRVVLTSVGREVAQAAASLLAEHRALEQWVLSAAGGHAGTLRLLTTVTPSNYVLPTVIARFEQAFPGVSVLPHELPSGEIWATFLNEPTDLALMPMAAEDDARAERVAVVEHVHQEPISFFVGPHSALARQSVVSWSDIQDQVLVGPVQRPYWTEMFRGLAQHGLRLPRRVISLDGAEGAKQLVQAGAYVGVHFRMGLRREFRTRTLVPLRIEGVALSQPFYLIRRRHVRPLPAVLEFARLLREALAAETDA